MMSAALSEQGKTRFPRSVFSGTPRPSKNAFTASGGKRVTALVRNRLLRGTFCTSGRTVVGHVAAALSGDVELAPQLGIALQQGDGCTLLGGGDGGHTAGRTAADDNYMLQVISSTFS